MVEERKKIRSCYIFLVRWRSSRISEKNINPKKNIYEKNKLIQQ